MTSVRRKAKNQKASKNSLFEHQEYKVSNGIKQSED